MNVEQAYDRWAETYDSMKNKTRDQDTIATQKNLESRPYATILEIGCGTGKNTLWLSKNCQKLVAVDFSEQMMSIAKQKVTAKNVCWQRLDITMPWTMRESHFDLITFNLVLEHVEDLPHVFAQAAARLAPGGHIHVSELHPFKQYLGSKARFETSAGTEELKVYMHHISDFTSAANDAGLEILALNEWFDGPREGVPRLLTLLAASR
ncbi:MAG: class I SAM-dependent methyltransferase [Pirellula sp.]